MTVNHCNLIMGGWDWKYWIEILSVSVFLFFISGQTGYLALHAPLDRYGCRHPWPLWDFPETVVKGHLPFWPRWPWPSHPGQEIRAWGSESVRYPLFQLDQGQTPPVTLQAKDQGGRGDHQKHRRTGQWLWACKGPKGKLPISFPWPPNQVGGAEEACALPPRSGRTTSLHENRQHN